MDVIGRAVNDEGGASHFANDAAEVGEEIGADFGRDEWTSILGAEDEVKDEIAGRVRQDSFAPSELACSFVLFPTASPWAAFLRRFAAKESIRRTTVRGGGNGQESCTEGSISARLSEPSEESRYL